MSGADYGVSAEAATGALQEFVQAEGKSLATRPESGIDTMADAIHALRVEIHELFSAIEPALKPDTIHLAAEVQGPDEIVSRFRALITEIEILREEVSVVRPRVDI